MEHVLRQYLESSGAAARSAALEQLTQFFADAFARCFNVAAGRPVTIRLLDYPLHELGGTLATEVNPMLGLRGVRQGVRWPELYRAQIDAIMEAASGMDRQALPLADLEIMVPLVNYTDEVRLIQHWIDRSRDSKPAYRGLRVKLGAMV